MTSRNCTPRPGRYERDAIAHERFSLARAEPREHRIATVAYLAVGSPPRLVIDDCPRCSAHTLVCAADGLCPTCSTSPHA